MPRFESFQDLEDRIRHVAAYDRFLQKEWQSQWHSWKHSIEPVYYVKQVMHEGLKSSTMRQLILRASLPVLAGSLVRLLLPSNKPALFWRGLSFSLQRLFAEWLQHKSFVARGIKQV